MHVKRILIPLDLIRGTVDPLIFVRDIAAEVPVCAGLLHVVDVNLAASETRIYAELCAEAEAALSNLAKLFLGNSQETRIIARIGRPHEQILAEARASRSELIILGGGKQGSWTRFFGAGTAGRVIRAAPCPTLILPPWQMSNQSIPVSLREDGPEIAQEAGTRSRRAQTAEACFAKESNEIHTIR